MCRSIVSLHVFSAPQHNPGLSLYFIVLQREAANCGEGQRRKLPGSLLLELRVTFLLRCDHAGEQRLDDSVPEKLK